MKKNKYKSEAKYWRMVAEKIADDLGAHIQYHGGICSYVGDVAWKSYNVHDRMLDRVNGHMKVHKNRIPLAGYGKNYTEMCFAYPEGKQMEARLLAALWMELEAKEGYDA